MPQLSLNVAQLANAAIICVICVFSISACTTNTENTLLSEEELEDRRKTEQAINLDITKNYEGSPTEEGCITWSKERWIKGTKIILSSVESQLRDHCMLNVSLEQRQGCMFRPGALFTEELTADDFERMENSIERVCRSRY